MNGFNQIKSICTELVAEFQGVCTRCRGAFLIPQRWHALDEILVDPSTGLESFGCLVRKALELWALSLFNRGLSGGCVSTGHFHPNCEHPKWVMKPQRSLAPLSYLRYISLDHTLELKIKSFG